MSTVSSLQLTRIIILSGSIVAATVIGFLLPELGILGLAMIVAPIYVATLPYHYRWATAVIIITYGSALIIPFMPGRPFWFEAAAYTIYPSIGLAILSRRLLLSSIKLTTTEVIAMASILLYSLLLVGLMLIRGTGLNVLGDVTIGGRPYFTHFALLAILLVMVAIPFSQKVLVRLFVASLALTFTWLISDLAFIYFRGSAILQLLYFFEVPTDAINFARTAESVGYQRVQSGIRIGIGATALVYVLFPLRHFLTYRAAYLVPIMLSIVALAFLSGHRAALLYVFILTVIVAACQRLLNSVNISAGIFAGFFIVLGVYVTVPSMPLPMQRVFSSLPGIQVDYAAAKDASMTVVGRRKAIITALTEDFPQHWLIGRGFTHRRVDLDYLTSLPYEMRRLLTGDYPHGAVSALVLTGLPGFLLSTTFFVAITGLGFDLIRRIRRKPVTEWGMLERSCCVVFGLWCMRTLYHNLIHGSAEVIAEDFFLYAGLIIAFRRTLMRAEEESPPEEKPEPPKLNYHPARSLPLTPVSPPLPRRA